MSVVSWKSRWIGWADQPGRLPNASTIDSIGVSIVYTYQFQTPLATILGFFGGGTPSLEVTDKTVMDLNPATS